MAKTRLSLDQRPVAHFLHIGKTAGTALTFALRQAQDTAKYRIVKHLHQVGLHAVPESDYYFFCVRDPIDRYLSGFVHREWRSRSLPSSMGDEEAKAIARFPTPGALAESLSAGGTEQRDAEAAMQTIQHVGSSYWDWFGDPDYFKSRADHILWIGRQESLDLRPLAATLGLEKLEMPTDPAQTNMSPSPKPDLSELARQNLREWYAKDYVFLELCDEFELGHGWQGLGSRDNGRTFVVRMMSERPFALRNAEAMRLARVVRMSKPPRGLLAPTAFLRHR
jgi:hypothetical protein